MCLGMLASGTRRDASTTKRLGSTDSCSLWIQGSHTANPKLMSSGRRSSRACALSTVSSGGRWVCSSGRSIESNVGGSIKVIVMHGYGAAAALSTTGISIRFGSGHWLTSMMMAAFPPPSAATATPVTGLWRPWNFLAISAFISPVGTGNRKSASKPGYISGVGIGAEVSVLEVESLTPPWYVIRWCSGSNQHDNERPARCHRM